MCTKCNDTGVIDTGNNDLPCESCIKGKTALFNVGGGEQQTGEEVLQNYNPPYNLRRPAAWYDLDETGGLTVFLGVLFRGMRR